MWLVFLASTAAGRSSVATTPTSPAIQRQLADHGAEAVVDDLLEAETWDTVLKTIAAGIPSWIRLAPLLSDGTDAGRSDRLGQSQGVALPEAPDAVLAVLDIRSRSVLCSTDVAFRPSFAEGDPANVPQYSARAIKAVSRVGDPAPAPAKRACFGRLEASRR